MKTKLIEEFGLRGVYHPMGADDPARLEEFEKTLGRPLPEDYREFLLHLAPSMFSRNVEFRPLEPSPWRGSDGLNMLEVFYGPDKKDGYDVIRRYETADGIPEGMISISFDPGASKILLALDEPAGRVYFQDKDTGKVYLCANTFTDFINSMELLDDDE